MKKFNSAFQLVTDDKKEIENLEMRSNMMNAISDIIKSKKWTQEQAAEFLKVSQPRISDLKNGKISNFSVDMLMLMLSKLGFTFKFDYSKKTQDLLKPNLI